jgi:hypothetical protein
MFRLGYAGRQLDHTQFRLLLESVLHRPLPPNEITALFQASPKFPAAALVSLTFSISSRSSTFPPTAYILRAPSNITRASRIAAVVCPAIDATTNLRRCGRESVSDGAQDPKGCISPCWAFSSSGFQHFRGLESLHQQDVFMPALLATSSHTFNFILEVPTPAMIILAHFVDCLDALCPIFLMMLSGSSKLKHLGKKLVTSLRQSIHGLLI